MIEFPRDRQQTIPESAVKIIGLGGAGANMLDRNLETLSQVTRGLGVVPHLDGSTSPY